MSTDLPSNGPLSHKVELPFPAAFEVVNAAAFEIISTWCARTHTAVVRDDTYGAVRYTITLATDECFDLFVLTRAAGVTAFVYQFRWTTQPRMAASGMRYSEEGTTLIADLMAQIARAIQEAVRYTDPFYTVRPTALAPTMPHHTDRGWPEVFRWQALYASAMSDQELARAQGVEPQTIANARQRTGESRKQRGRPKKK